MQHLETFRRLGLAACLAVASLASHAATLDINLAGWQSYTEWLGPGSENSEAFVSIGAGSTVTGFEYIGLTFSTENGSWLREFTLSVASADDVEGLFMDWRPSTVSGGGSFGPASGMWSGPTGAAGLFGRGASFVAASGMLWVSSYESFDDPFGEDEPWRFADSTVTAGTLRIYYDAAPVPEPETYGLMALGLGVLGAVARRRKQDQ